MKDSLIKWSVGLAVAVAIGTVAWAAAADSGSPSAAAGNMRPSFFRGRMAAALGITDAQKAQIHDILHAAQPTVRPLTLSMIQERRALRNLIQASSVDEQAIRAQVAKVSGIQADLAVQRAYLHQKITAVLTPEQIQRIGQVKASVEKRIDNRMSRFEKGIEGPGGQ